MIKKTKRLILRPLELKDYASWKESNLNNFKPQNAWDNNYRKAVGLTMAKFKTLLSKQKRLRDKDKYYNFAVITKSKNEIIGSVAAMDVIRSITQSAFLGYYIHNTHWGKGYGKEAVFGFMNFCFKNLKIHRLEAGIEPHNKRSTYLVKSLGLRKEGLKKRMIYLRDDWQDLTIYSATCEDFGIKWKPDKKLKINH